MLITFSKWLGFLTILLGVGGLMLGEESIGGLLNIELVEDLIHIITGAILLYAGFSDNTQVARKILGTLGVIYLLVAIIGMTISPNLFGLLPNHGYSVVDNVIHLALGIIFILVARKYKNSIVEVQM